MKRIIKHSIRHFCKIVKMDQGLNPSYDHFLKPLHSNDDFLKYSSFLFSIVNKHPQEEFEKLIKFNQNHINQEQIYYGYFDGACNKKGASCGFLIKDLEQKIIYKEGFRLPKGYTNNQAEYMGFCYLLYYMSQFGIYKAQVIGDSLLVVNQVQNKWRVRNSNLENINQFAKSLMKRFEFLEINHVLREFNKEADEISSKVLNQLVIFKKRKQNC